MKNTSTSDEILRARLLEAYQADPDKSKMGRLRKQYDTIIDMQKGGMSLEKILAALNEDPQNGLGLTMKTFNGYMYLLRKEKTASRVVATTPATVAQETPKSGKSKDKGQAKPDLTDKKEEKPEAEKITPMELIRPPGISDGEWSSLRAKAAAEKRKINRNLGE